MRQPLCLHADSEAEGDDAGKGREEAGMNISYTEGPSEYTGMFKVQGSAQCPDCGKWIAGASHIPKQTPSKEEIEKAADFIRWNVETLMDQHRIPHEEIKDAQPLCRLPDRRGD